MFGAILPAALGAGRWPTSEVGQRQGLGNGEMTAGASDGCTVASKLGAAKGKLVAREDAHESVSTARLASGKHVRPRCRSGAGMRPRD